MSAPDGRRHILFVHAADELYGADRVLLGLVRGLDRDRYRSTVVLPDDVDYEGRLSAELRASDIPVLHMRLAVLRRKYMQPVAAARLAWWYVRSSLILARIARRERVDLICSHTAAVMSGALAAVLSRRPHIWHIHEIVVRPAAVRRVLARLLPAMSVRLIAVSVAVREHLVESNPDAAKKTVVIHNGIDPTSFIAATDRNPVRAELGIPDAAPLAGMIGRVGTWKGQELFLSAVPRVIKQVPNAWFLFVGGVFDAEAHHFDRLRQWAKQHDVAHRVIFSDFRTDVPDVLAAMDVFVQPSLLPDPFPMTVLEAMAAAKPVIATDHGGPREMVVPGVTGYLVAPDAPGALAERLIELLTDRTLAARLGAAGRERVIEEFSLAAFTDACAGLFEDVLRHPG